MANAPFIKDRPFVPGDQVQRFGMTQTLHMVHYDTPMFGVGQILGAESQLFNDPNRLGNDDLCSLKEAGKFSDWKQFVIYAMSLQCFFNQLATPAQGEATAEELYDLFVYYSRLHIRYQDAEKQVLWADLLPSGGGVYGSTTSTNTFHLTNGNPVNSLFVFEDQLVITPQKTFRITMKWHSSIQNVAGVPTPQQDPRTRFNAATASQKLVRLYMHGIEGRDVSNG